MKIRLHMIVTVSCLLLFALDTLLNLDAGANKEQLFSAMQGHVLAQSELIGIFRR
jgi:phosphatidylethanolamine-binding protein (PEBP) family uncharacterized protein